LVLSKLLSAQIQVGRNPPLNVDLIEFIRKEFIFLKVSKILLIREGSTDSWGSMVFMGFVSFKHFGDSKGSLKGQRGPEVFKVSFVEI